MSTIFEKIIAREIPAFFLYEDDVCIVILDKFPVYKGQTLVIPKQPVEYVFDLDDEIYQHIFAIAKKVSKALDTTLNTVRTCMLLEGLEIPHTHIKLYPITESKLEIHGGAEMSDEELETLAIEIKKALD